jgi:hypothetical protein
MSDEGELITRGLKRCWEFLKRDIKENALMKCGNEENSHRTFSQSCFKFC